MALPQFAHALNYRDQAEPHVQETILDGGYTWNEQKKVYEDGTDQIIICLPNDQFIWMYGVFGKVLKNTQKLNIWLNGRSREFMSKFMSLSGLSPEPTGNGERPVPYEKEPVQGDETDKLIFKLKKQAGNEKKLPSDLMIDLGMKAQKATPPNEKLLNFLKTMQPVNENTLKRGQLDTLIKAIIKGVLKEGFSDSHREDDVLSKADKAWGKADWYIEKSKRGEAGTVYKISSDKERGKLLWQSPSGEWKAMDASRKWVPVDPQSIDAGNPSESMKEMSTSAGAGPVSTPFAFKKTKGMEEEEIPLEEISTAGDAGSYNIPSAFARKGGSEKGIKGSEALGYTLTPQGKKDMSRTADKLEEVAFGAKKPRTKTCSHCNMMAINGVWTHEQGCPNSKDV